MVELLSVDGRTVSKSVGLNVNLPVVAMVAVDGQEVAAAWGLAWSDGRCILWFLCENPKLEYRFIVMREARKMMARAVQLGETELFTYRDPEFATSARLLKILGFKPHSIEDEKEIWRMGFGE